MKYTILKDADFGLVEFDKDNKPTCKKHGAMNKLTENGIWRCISTYLGNGNGGLLKENNCKAGCQELKL